MVKLRVTIHWQSGTSVAKDYSGMIFNLVVLQIFNEVRRLDYKSIKSIIIAHQ